MTVDVATQLTSLIQALLLGVSAGVLYDLLRILRVRVRVPLLVHGLDLMFWLVVTAGIFLWSNSAWGGVVRWYGIAFLLLGGVVYFLVASRIILFIGYRLADLTTILWKVATLPLTVTRIILKKIQNFLKNLFQFKVKWYKINHITEEMDAVVRRRATAGTGGVDSATKTRGNHNKNRRVWTAHLHGHVTSGSARADSAHRATTEGTEFGGNGNPDEQSGYVRRNRKQRRSRDA